jgi:hypothetical protein
MLDNEDDENNNNIILYFNINTQMASYKYSTKQKTKLMNTIRKTRNKL